MIKEFSLMSILLGSLILSGCGGSGDSDTNPINDKNYIVILRNIPSGICESQIYRDTLSEELIGVLTEERANTVNCADYGKNDDEIECGIRYYDGPNMGNVACVVGADGSRFNKYAKVLQGSIYSNIIESSFIQVSE